MWQASRQALSAFNFSIEEEDKILGKAFGQLHSPYWGEDRKKEVPKSETVNEILDYLRALSLSDDDLGKLLKKFPEVLGCNLEHELKTNVQVLEKEWGIKGKSFVTFFSETRKYWVIMWIVREIVWHSALDAGFGFSCLTHHTLF
ncbi:hypothetical protein I3760_16G061500 [Carya illinoinensis]|nr:hypothetical protein I3760_16G061500 [Carya illinoinensis]